MQSRVKQFTELLFMQSYADFTANIPLTKLRKKKKYWSALDYILNGHCKSGPQYVNYDSCGDLILKIELKKQPNKFYATLMLSIFEGKKAFLLLITAMFCNLM